MGTLRSHSQKVGKGLVLLLMVFTYSAIAKCSMSRRNGMAITLAEVHIEVQDRGVFHAHN